MKNLKLGSLSIPITQYASQGNAVLGIRDSGKSYSATYLAEQLYAAGVPFVAFDPSGVWKFMRVPGKGAGLPIVVAGGKVPDLPLTPQSAPEIVRAAMRANVSLVLDLYDIHMSKADWSRIVESCVRVLLYENGEHGLRHIFIEEAAEFAPQQIAGDKAKVYAEVEKLARIGGNALLGYTLINQRAEQVNKAVLELCDCLFLHRQKGKNSLNSLSKWLEYSQGGDTKEIIKGLPTLPSGECWVWPAGAEHATHVKMPQKETFHPDRRALIANPAAANVQRIDATKFVSELKGSLEKYLEEAKANDPAELKKRIRELERQVAAKKPAEPMISDDDLVLAEKRGFERGKSSIELAAFHNTKRAASLVRAALNNLGRLAEELDTETQAAEQHVKELAPPAPARPMQPVVPRSSPVRTPVSTGVKRQTNGAGDSSLPKGEAATLAACIQFPAGLRREQLTVLTGYKRSSRDAYIQRLRERGYVDTSGDRVTATDTGIAAMPDAEPLPTGQALQDYWLERLPEGERKILGVLIERYPEPVPRGDLDEQTGYQRSSRDAYLQRLRAKQLVNEPTRGAVVASEDLF